MDVLLDFNGKEVMDDSDYKSGTLAFLEQEMRQKP